MTCLTTLNGYSFIIFLSKLKEVSWGTSGQRYNIYYSIISGNLQYCTVITYILPRIIVTRYMLNNYIYRSIYNNFVIKYCIANDFFESCYLLYYTILQI